MSRNVLTKGVCHVFARHGIKNGNQATTDEAATDTPHDIQPPTESSHRYGGLVSCSKFASECFSLVTINTDDILGNGVDTTSYWFVGWHRGYAEWHTPAKGTEESSQEALARDQNEEEWKTKGSSANTKVDVGDDNDYGNDDKAEDEVPMEVVELITQSVVLIDVGGLKATAVSGTDRLLCNVECQEMRTYTPSRGAEGSASGIFLC